MKNLKFKLAAAALVLGIGSALATASNPFANKTWGRQSNGVYVDLTGHSPDEYNCTASSSVCTAIYPATQNPNTNPANPISIQQGAFSGL
ncbi:hypothetical protein FPZ42_07015 [Mucilaginibacter achroorhodeus]|uniref:Uncharacterized protein n=1 Tax=Mucilaginibacter achroorhodeus TaxID=2599294 RepID=A0A563U607_9SPHI|nr:DUF6520 family protein [Mucilaginibacter achroorhodeus]TWR26781.1 hypothetical protein FPZ42_07015 [Mucilaginibacter achroorhodeus]